MPMKMCWMQAIFVVLWLQCMRTEVLSLRCRSPLHSQCVCWISPCQLQQLLQYCFCQKAWLDTIAAAGCPAVIRSEEKVSTLPNPSFPGLRGAALWVSCRNTCWSPAARAVPERSAWHAVPDIHCRARALEHRVTKKHLYSHSGFKTQRKVFFKGPLSTEPSEAYDANAISCSCLSL